MTPGYEQGATSGRRASGAFGGRSRRMSGEQRRAAIHAAGRELALLTGLQSVTHRSIAAHLRVTHTLVVHFAPSIEELRVRVCVDVLNDELIRVQQVVDRTEGGLHRLRTLVRDMTRPDREDLAGIWLDGWGIGRQDESMAAAMRGVMTKWHELVERILDECIRSGDVRPVDTTACAWEFNILLDGLNAHALVDFGTRADYGCRVAAPFEARLELDPGALTHGSEDR